MSNGRPARRKLAQRDGETIRIIACCRLEITIGVGRLDVAHDNTCAALNPSTPAGMTARIQANQAVQRVLAERGIRATAVMA